MFLQHTLFFFRRIEGEPAAKENIGKLGRVKSIDSSPDNETEFKAVPKKLSGFLLRLWATRKPGIWMDDSGSPPQV